MAKIGAEHLYDGAQAKITRMGLSGLVDEIRGALRGLRLEVKEERHANGGAEIRARLDDAIAAVGGWTKTVSGDIDWRKCRRVNGTELCVGVEVQISARSDLLVIDVIHLRNALEAGEIDVGVIVVPTDTLSAYLPERAPNATAARRHVRDARAEQLPIVLMPFEHDGPGKALPKRRTNLGRLPPAPTHDYAGAEPEENRRSDP